MNTKRSANRTKTLNAALAALARGGFRPGFIDLGDFTSVGVLMSLDGAGAELRSVAAVHDSGELHVYIGRARKEVPGAIEAMRRVPAYVVLTHGEKNLVADELAMLAGAEYAHARKGGASASEAATKAVRALFRAAGRTAGTGDYRGALNAGAAAYDDAEGTYADGGYMAPERPEFRAFCVAAAEYLNPNP